jgi:hypothetical protein
LTRISVTQTISEQMTLDSELLRDIQPSFLKPWFEKWNMLGIVEKAYLKKFGGIPKGYFSFGLCDSQKSFASWFFEGLKVLSYSASTPWNASNCMGRIVKPSE